MGPNFQSDSLSASAQILEGQLRECYGRVVYTHKTHEKCADRALARHHGIKLSQIVLSILTTSSVLVKVFGSGNWVLILAAVCSTILLILNTYTKDYDLGAFAQRHRETAAKLWNVRERMLSLLTDFRSGLIDQPLAITRRDALQEELFTIYSGAPPTSSKGYQAAQKALKISEELTFSDEEINNFLPKELRRTKL